MKSGFSLMEMLVVLLIIAIITAVSAPMISRKMMHTVANETSPWEWINNHHIIFNPTGNIGSAIIGNKYNDIALANEPMFFVSSNQPKDRAQIELGRRSDALLHIAADNDGSLTISDNYAAKNGTAIGKGANAGENATAVGNGASAEKNGTAIGEGAGAEKNGTAIGKGTQVGENATAVGSSNTASGPCSSAFGNDNTASGPSSSAFGNINTASGEESIAIGTENYARAEGSTAVGHHNNFERDNTGKYSTAVGYGNHAKVNYSAAIGYNNNAIQGATKSLAIGYVNKTLAENSAAIGSENEIGSNATNSVAIGYNNKVSNDNEMVLGLNVKKDNKIVLGNADTTVYIPGKLVVDGSVILGRNGGNVYASIAQENGNNRYLYRIYRNDDVADAHRPDLHVHDDASGTTHYYSTGTDYSTIFSDRRLKNVGKVFQAGLDEIKKLEVFNYTFKDDKDKTPRVGVMAQDLQKIFPNAVIKGEDGYLRIRMEDMFYAIVNAVKQLDAKIEALKNNEILALTKRVTELEKQNADLVKQNQELAKQNEDFDARLKAIEKKLK